MKNNRINIDVTLSDYSDVYNKFNSNSLSSDLSNYIYDECIGKPIKSNININIKSEVELSKEQKSKICDMIRSNYGINIKESSLYLKYFNIKSLVLFLVGIILIVIYSVLTNYNLIWLSEIILIVGWLMIGEAVYNYIFLEVQKRIEIKRYKKLATCKINFVEDDINESN